jgi:NIMA (never in mitosis gene a)-related kinase
LLLLRLRNQSLDQSSPPAPEYHFSDEENLPSPFLKRVERETTIPPGGLGARNKGPNKKPSSGNELRVVGAANAANANANAAAGTRPGSAGERSVKNGLTRLSVGKLARKHERLR